MRRYETIIIVDSDVSDENCALIIDKLSSLIEKHEGFLIETNDWGIKKLAYEIKKKSRGHYFRFDFCSKVTMIFEMEHFLRIDDNILKFMTIILDKEADLEAIKNIISETEQAEQTEIENNIELENQKKDTKPSEPENTVNEEE